MTNEQADAIIDAIEAAATYLKYGSDYMTVSGYMPGTKEDADFLAHMGDRAAKHRRQLSERIAKGIRSAVFPGTPTATTKRGEN